MNIIRKRKEKKEERKNKKKEKKEEREKKRRKKNYQKDQRVCITHSDREEKRIFLNTTHAFKSLTFLKSFTSYPILSISKQNTPSPYP